MSRTTAGTLAALGLLGATAMFAGCSAERSGGPSVLLGESTHSRGVNVTVPPSPPLAWADEPRDEAVPAAATSTARELVHR